MQIGPYRVLDELARGGQGIVFRAEHPSGQRVALKLLARERALSRRRLETELATLRRLRHPNLVRVVDAGEHHGAPWIAQELVEGESLQARLDRVGAFAVGKAVEVAHSLALALDYAHGCGVLHRDLKPANVMLRPDGTPVLLDFGLARDLEDERSRVTQSGVLMGSPGYWAPELATGQRAALGVPTDVYGLGALAYAMISGRPPVDPRSLDVATSTECEPLHRVRPDVPRALSDVVARCLRAEPSARYPTCAAVARALLAAQEGEARPARLGLHLALPWVLASLALLGVGGGLVAVLVTPSDGGRAEPAPDPYLEAFAPIKEVTLAGDHARALRMVEALLGRFPERPRLISLRGELLVRLRRYEEALPHPRARARARPRGAHGLGCPWPVLRPAERPRGGLSQPLALAGPRPPGGGGVDGPRLYPAGPRQHGGRAGGLRACADAAAQVGQGVAG